jgi:hypothetical protein
MGEGRIGSFTQSIEHEVELNLQASLHRTTALTRRHESPDPLIPSVFLCSTPVLTERQKQRGRYGILDRTARITPP